ITQVNPEALGKRELTSLEGILETLPERLEAPLSLTHLEIIRYTVGGLLDVEKAIKREAIEKTIDFSKEELRPKHFFGRKDELKTLSKWVNERKKVLAISGELGIGKTALILKMLDDYEGRKHIFWYKCREWDTAKTIVSSLAAFLSKMNKKTLQQYVQSKESIELGEVSTILDTALQDVNALLIFDNSDRAKSDVVNLFSLIKELVTTKENTALVVIGRYIPKFYTASDINKKIVMELTVGGLDMESSRKILGPKIDNSDFKIIYKFTEGNPSLLEQISTEIEHQKDIKKYLREKIFSKMLMKGG
ncbi:MAG: ATP-binding protein, partial [Candidatus Thermoplasmatota archaeon]